MELFPAFEDTLLGASHLIRTGKLTSVAAVEKCLGAICARDGDVQAWVALDRASALQQAEQLDDELRQGQSRGPLHGIPIGIKDIVDVEGYVTACGSPWMAKKERAEQDAGLVAQLREAGAVILGKTVTTQFASFDPPVTRNPWNLNRTPGGSSSGSAAAVASGMCLGAIGSQTGGSLTRPASFCGVATCKPSYGAVNVVGVFPLAPRMDHPGPMARTVADVALMLSVIDEWAEWLSVAASPMPFPPRIGRLRGFFEDQVDPGYQKLLGETAKLFAAAGATVIDVPAPVDFQEVIRLHRIMMATESGYEHRTYFAEHRDEYAPCIRSLIEEGQRTSAIDYMEACDAQPRVSGLLENSIEGLDMLITPATIGPAPDTSTTGNPLMNSPWSYSGLPTVSFPIGLSSDGLPLAVQCVGRMTQDAQLTCAAMWCEEVIRAAHGKGRLQPTR